MRADLSPGTAGPLNRGPTVLPSNVAEQDAQAAAKSRTSGLWFYVGTRVSGRVRAAVYRRRWALAALSLAAVSAAVFLAWRTLVGQEIAIVGEYPIEVTIQEVQPRGNTLLLVVKEKNGNRQVGLQIGETEARVIARERGLRVAGEQPLEYDLMRDLVNELGGRVERVIVSGNDSSREAARVIVSATDGAPRAIRAQAGDAIALAMRTGAPIFVEDRLLSESSTRGG